MSTPITSTKPETPTGTSNPVSWKSWFTKIGDWIDGLSPEGATTFFGTGSWTVTSSRIYTVPSVIERRGEWVQAYGEILINSAYSLVNTGEYIVGKIAPPPVREVRTVLPSQRGVVQCRIKTDGTFSLLNYSGATMAFAINDFIGVGGIHYRTAVA